MRHPSSIVGSCDSAPSTAHPTPVRVDEGIIKLGDTELDAAIGGSSGGEVPFAIQVGSILRPSDLSRFPAGSRPGRHVPSGGGK